MRANGRSNGVGVTMVAPLTAEEALLYRNLSAVGGGEVANLVAATLHRAGLEVLGGNVSVDWDGRLVWRAPLALGRTVRPRVLLAALGGGTPQDRAVAVAVLIAEARALAASAPGMIRDYADRVRDSVRRAKGVPPADDVDGRATAVPSDEAPPARDPGRIITGR